MVTRAQASVLRAMDIDVWVRRGDAGASAGSAPVDDATVTVSTDLAATEISRMDWPTLGEKVSGCERCELHKTRTQTVFGVGNEEADWLLVGEAPGAEEDRQGEPFVGRAGQLLNAMLAALGLDRTEVYIANILKCRPPRNRDPRPEEVACCERYLERQIALIQPRIILALGRIAAQNLLKDTTPIGRMRGREYQYPGMGVPVIVTYHPAYLLRSPTQKAKVWQDLILAKRIVAEQP